MLYKVKDMAVITDASKILSYANEKDKNPISITFFNPDETNTYDLLIELHNGASFSWTVGVKEQINEEFDPIKKITITNTDTVEVKYITRVER